ncbi:MAG TPA: DnaJ domain-containing protein [bacterium]|nr:DnaJ domain-containing protein [bacterium]
MELMKIADSGDLAEVPFGRVFYRFCREKRTGVLDVRDKPAAGGGRILKRVMMVEGSRFAAQGGSAMETLPQILLDQGKLTPDGFEALKAELKGDWGKMEQKVLAGAVVPGSEIPELLALQAELKVRSLLCLFRGHYDFKPQPVSQVMGKHILMPFGVEKALLEGAIEHYPAARINKEFPGIEKKNFRPAGDFKERIGGFGLPPSVLRWLRSSPESFSWDGLLQGAPVGAEQAAVMLLALYFTEVIVLARADDDFPVGRAYLEAREEAVSRAEQKEEKRAAAELKSDETKAEKEEKKAEKSAEPKLPIEEMLDKEMSDAETLKEIERLLTTAHNTKGTYFDLLGLKESTPTSKIKQVYFKFAKKFHPDANPELFKGEVKDRVEELFTKLSEAYNTLADGESRQQYANSLKSQVSKQDMEKGQRAIEAEMDFQKAEVLLKRSAWAEAAGLLERAAQLQADEPEYGLYLAWARYKQKGPSEAARAQKAIKAALDKRPKVADGYYYLGQLAKDEGNLDKAEEYLSKASQMKPHDIDIKRELQLMQRRRVKEATTKKGGLFGKKK